MGWRGGWCDSSPRSTLGILDGEGIQFDSVIRRLACTDTSEVASQQMARRLVGLISDTHGLLRPEAMRALQGCDLIIHAGDIGREAVLTALRAVAPVTAVRGNVDTGLWAHTLPRTEAVKIEQVWVYIIHDVKELDLAPEAAGFKVVVNGHSHLPSIQERQGVIYVNPGSAGPRRFNLPVSLARMCVQDGSAEVKLVALDV